MKYITTFLLLFVTDAYADGYFPFGKIGARTVYPTKAACEQAEKQFCANMMDELGNLRPVDEYRVDANGGLLETGKKAEKEVAKKAEEDAKLLKKEEMLNACKVKVKDDTLCEYIIGG